MTTTEKVAAFLVTLFIVSLGLMVLQNHHHDEEILRIAIQADAKIIIVK